MKYLAIIAVLAASPAMAFDFGPKLSVDPILTLSYDLEDEVGNSWAGLDARYKFTETTDLFLYGEIDLMTGKSRGVSAGVETTLGKNLTVKGYFTIDEFGTNDNLNVELQMRF